MLLHEIKEQDGDIIAQTANGLKTRISNYSELLHWLVECSDVLPCFWDLDANVSILLKLLPQNKVEELSKSAKHDCVIYTENSKGETIGRFFIRYIPKRMIFIGGYQNVTYYGLGNFFGFDYRHDVAPILTEQQKIGEQMMSELFSVGIKPKRLTSHAAIVDYVFDELNLPTHKDCPIDVNQISWNCCGRAWVEAIKIGHWENAFSYDISASFPSELAELWDLRIGDFVHEPKYRTDAKYGWITMDYNIKDGITPFTKAGKGGVFNACGKYPDVTTKTLYDIALKHNKPIGKIKDAWWWVPNDTPELPLYDTMRHLYKNRAISPILNKLMKKSSASIYGKLIATIDNGTKPVPQFNPAWASIVEDGIKGKVWSFILDNHLENSLIHIATDDVTVDAPIEGFTPDDCMGGWRFDGSGECLVLSTSAMFFKKRKPCQIPLLKAIEMIKTNPKSREWTTHVERRLAIGECLHNISMIGSISKLQSSFEIPFEPDRYFAEYPNTGEQLLSHIYNSTAYNAKELR
jgi:hypothetical protein